MQHLTRLVKVIGIAVSFGIAMPVFAESAPVYDADSMPQQYDNGSDQGEQLPPPPPPQDGGAFVPVQQQQQQQASSTQQFAPSTDAPATSMSIEQRVRRLEQQINNILSNDTSARVDSLQDQIQTLRGQVEQLTHQLAQRQNQQKSMYSDLDKRLATNASVKPSDTGADAVDDTSANSEETAANIPVLPAVTKPARKTPKQIPKTVKVNTDSIAAKSTRSVDVAPAKSTADQPNVAEEQQIYQTAYNLIKAKKYNDAVIALNGMLKKYPSGQFAANAHYWLGELYGLMTKNDQALTEFSTVVKTYPDSPRVSDAQLKVGLIYASQFKWVDAKSAFKKVINHYPGTASARLALEQLKQIKQAGH